MMIPIEEWFPAGEKPADEPDRCYMFPPAYQHHGKDVISYR